MKYNQTSMVIDTNNLIWKLYFCSDKEHIIEETEFQGFSPALMKSIIADIRNFAFYLKRSEFIKNITKFIFCIDASSNWRKEIYKEYKMNRKKEEIDSNTVKKNLEKIKEIFPKLGFNVLSYDLQEADDIAYNYSLINHKKENIILYSSDEDWTQIIKLDRENIKQFNVMKYKQKDFIYDIVLRKSIIGDSGDNIKGVQGIGEKKYPYFKKKLLTDTSFLKKFKNIIKENQLLVDLTKNPQNEEVQNFLKNKNYTTLGMKSYDLMKICSQYNLTSLDDKHFLFSYENLTHFKNYR